MRTGEQIKFGFFILLTFEFKNVKVDTNILNIFLK